MKYLLSFLLFFSFSLPAHSNDWTHIRLQSTDGTKIAIDFIAYKEQYTYGPVWTANPVWIDVTRQGLRDSRHVRLVLKSFFLTEFSHLTYYNQEPEIRELTLNFANDTRFTGELPYGLKTCILYRVQELLVQIDNEWLVDPISGTSIFKFDMAAAEKARIESNNPH